MLLRPDQQPEAKLLGAIKINDFPVLPAGSIEQNLRVPMTAALAKGLDPAQNSVVPIHLMCSLLHTIELLQRDASIMMQMLVTLYRKEKFTEDDLVSEDAHLKEILEAIKATASGQTLPPFQTED